MRLAAIAVASACVTGCISELADTPAAFARADGQRVLCGIGVDGETIPLDAIDAALERALAADEVLILFAHEPGRTIDPARVIAILDRAEARGVPFRTFPALADPAWRTAGLAFGFDDFSVAAWAELRAPLRGRPVTFFVSNFDTLTPALRADLHALAADGHAIEAHGMGHRDAASYVDHHGLHRYLADEIDPLLAAMRADGFQPTTFAYPYGARTRELDRALLERFRLVRSLTYLDRSAWNTAPCPY